jgi:hypothetical protein
MSKETDVRDAATKLFDAIEAAKKDGLFVAWPSNHQGLPAIAISEVKREPPPLATPPAPEPEPAPAVAASPAFSRTFGDKEV